MKILFSCINLMHYYIQVGANHYARQFDKHGHEVLFLSNPLNPFHFIRHKMGDVVRKRFSIWRSGGQKFGEKGIAFEPLSLFPNYGIFPFSTVLAIRLGQKTCIPRIKKYCKEKGFSEVDILWIDNIFYEFLLDIIPHKVSVFRVADEMRDYKKFGSGHYKMEEKIFRRSDLTFCVTSKLVNHAKQFRPDNPTHFIPNGVDFDHFHFNQDPEPDVYRNIPRPRAVFVGAFYHMFSPDFFFSLAKKLPEISFIIISPKTSGIKIPDLSNLYFVGPVDYERLPPYLKHTDVGIITLSPNRKQPVILPLKAYQYMAAGLPYVGVGFDEKDYEALGKPPGFYSTTPEEMVNDIRRALALNADQKKIFVEYASSNSWSLRYETVMGHVNHLNKL